MHMMTKVFIILNALLALIFAVASLTLYAKRVDWVDQTVQAVKETAAFKKKYEEKCAEYDKLDKTTSVRIQELKDKLQEQENLYTEAKNQNSSLQRTNNELTEKISANTDRLNDLQKMLEQKETRNNELQARIDDLIKTNNKFAKDKEFAEKRAIELMADLKQAEAEMLQLGKNNAELLEQVATLRIDLQKYISAYGKIPTAAVSSPVPISGRVLQVEEAVDLVMLSVGEKDKVKKGMEFVISRGQDYVAKVRVRTVYEDMCSAEILTGMQKLPIKVSDLAQTMD